MTEVGYEWVSEASTAMMTCGMARTVCLRVHGHLVGRKHGNNRVDEDFGTFLRTLSRRPDNNKEGLEEL